MEMASGINSVRRLQDDPTYLAKCATCGVSKRFYTAQGVSGFRFEHSDHDVTVVGPQDEAETGMEREHEEPQQSVPSAEAAEASEANTRLVVNLERLDVTVLPSEVDDSFHFEVAGSTSEGGFSLIFPLAKAKELGDFVKGGSYVIARNGETQEFSWTQDRVRADSQVSRLLGIQQEVVAESVMDESNASAVELKEAPVPEPATTEEAIPAAVQEPPAAKEVVVAVKPDGEKERETLLVAESFYLKDGEDVEKEALRISRALKELRWGVKPPYLISVMIDDNVGIETNGDAIMNDLIMKIEPLGYTFVAVNAPNGKPTAWFKRKGEPQADKSAEQATNNVNSIMHVVDLLVEQLEIERVETGKAAQDEGAREERLSSLFRQLKELASASGTKA